MDIGGMNGGSTEGLPSAWVDRDIWSTYGFQDPTRIRRCILQGCIAVNGSNPKEIQRWVMSSQKDSKSILMVSILSQPLQVMI